MVGPALTIKVGAWNTVHATNCTATISTKGVITITLYPSEGGSFYTTVPQAQAMLIAQCALGNWTSFYVTKKVGANYVWSQVESWSYK